MTTRSLADTTSTTPAVARRRSRSTRIALWILQIALAAMFLFAGGMKLAGGAQVTAMFDLIGLGQWFRYVTGLIEVGSALALLVPSIAVFGALLLIPTMIGAITAHLFVIGGSPAGPVVLLIGSIVIAWSRRGRALGGNVPGTPTPQS